MPAAAEDLKTGVVVVVVVDWPGWLVGWLVADFISQLRKRAGLPGWVTATGDGAVMKLNFDFEKDVSNVDCLVVPWTYICAGPWFVHRSLTRKH